MNTRIDLTLSFILLISALGPCSQEGDRASADDTTEQSNPSNTNQSLENSQASPSQPPLILERPKLTPITSRIATTIKTISERDASRANNVFAKMGGSSVVNHGFLHCFDPSEGSVNLHGRHELEETLSFFRSGRVGARSPFVRTSVAAAVGWSIRQAMGGRPSYIMQEIRTTRARWALAFFGSNDVMGKDAHTFAQRLDRLVNMLVEKGVVPILGSTYPRRPRDIEMNEQVRRYNRISYATADAWGLPYIDFHQAMLPLPGRGLARDGYHPNSYTVGPQSRACDFGEVGLQYGNNQRNLLVLTMLDQLRRKTIEEEQLSPSYERVVGEGTYQDPKKVLVLPFSDRVEISQFESHTDQPQAQNLCSENSQSNAQYTYQIMLEQPQRVRISAVTMGGFEMHVHVQTQEGQCLGARSNEEVVSLPAGIHRMIITAVRPQRSEQTRTVHPAMLFVIDLEPER